MNVKGSNYLWRLILDTIVEVFVIKKTYRERGGPATAHIDFCNDHTETNTDKNTVIAKANKA